MISASLFHLYAPIFPRLNEEAHANKLSMPILKDSRQKYEEYLEEHNSLEVLIAHESASNDNDSDEYSMNVIDKSP